MHGAHARSRQHGFTYMGVLFLVGLLGLAAASIGTAASHERRREKEAELLFVGHQFRDAIRRYYEAAPGPLKQYPPNLEVLLKDPRTPAVRRHLRRIHADPITGKAQWGLVEAPGGGVMGVFSLSGAAPLKTGNFRKVDASFEGGKVYSDWKFVYIPPQPGRNQNFVPPPQGGARN